MGKDPFNLFRFRSKKQEQKEREAYAAWAFPYGPAQKEKIRRKETASSPLWGEEDTFCREMELALQEALGRRVRITQKEGGGGTLELEFFSRPDLADLAKRLEE